MTRILQQVRDTIDRGRFPKNAEGVAGTGLPLLAKAAGSKAADTKADTSALEAEIDRLVYDAAPPTGGAYNPSTRQTGESLYGLYGLGEKGN